MFGLSYILSKVNGNLLYNLSFVKSYRTFYELKIQCLDQDSQLFENGTAEEMFTRTHGVIVLCFFSTQDKTIVWRGSVGLEYISAESLEENLLLISPN